MFPSFLAITTLYIILILLSAYFFFKLERDVWLQGLWTITGLIAFIFLVVTSYHITNIQMGNPTHHEMITPDSIDINTNDYSQELFNASGIYHYYYFNTNLVDQENIVKAEVCFRYNNTGGDNIAEIVGGQLTPITPQIFIDNGTGTKCVQILNMTCIKNCNLIGFNCKDCSAPNPLYLLIDNNAELVDEIEVTISTSPPGSDYDIEQEKAHLFWVNTKSLPKKEVNELFFLFLWLLGFLILGFALRGMIKIIKGESEIILDDEL